MRKFLSDLSAGKVADIVPAPETPQFKPSFEIEPTELPPPAPPTVEFVSESDYSLAISTKRDPTFYEGV